MRRASWKRFKGSPILSKDLYAQLQDYDRADFHPNDNDTTAMEAEWRAKLFGDDGRLNELLTPSTAA